MELPDTNLVAGGWESPNPPEIWEQGPSWPRRWEGASPLPREGDAMRPVPPPVVFDLQPTKVIFFLLTEGGGCSRTPPHTFPLLRGVGEAVESRSLFFFEIFIILLLLLPRSSQGSPSPGDTSQPLGCMTQSDILSFFILLVIYRAHLIW